MFIRVSFPLYDLNETRIHVYVSRQQLCRAYTFLVGNPIGEREFWILVIHGKNMLKWIFRH